MSRSEPARSRQATGTPSSPHLVVTPVGDESKRGPAFEIFPGDGEMARRCRAHDWSATPLGPLERWTQGMRTLTATVIASGLPTIVLWGAELIQLYNDAYAPILGEKHPAGLGVPTRECWPEAWSFNEPIYRRVLAGETVTLENQRYRLERRGAGGPVEDVFITISYAPARIEGGIGGVFITLLDTTAQVEQERLARELAEANRRLEEQQAELLAANEQLQETAVEFEAQAEELQVVAAQLEERTEEAERARCEAEAARERMVATFESITDPFFTVDERWIVTYVNPPTEKVIGRPREAVIGRHLWEEFPEAVGTPFYEGAHRALRERRPVDVEAHYPPPLDFWAAMRMYPLADGLAVYYQDVTARKKAEAEVLAGEQRFRDLFEQAPIAVAVLTGPDHVYSAMSPRYATFVPGGRANLGRPFREAVPEIASREVAELMDHVFRTGEPYEARERLVRLDRDGDGVAEDYWFDIGYQPLRDADGKVYAIASTSLDVTAHVLARREVEAARLESERQRDLAEAANRAKSEFLSTMSHELRTPLNAIQGYAELLAIGVRGAVTPEQRQDLDRIRRASHHLLSLITDILNFARLEAGQVEFRVDAVPLAPVIADLESLVSPQLEAKGLAFAVDGDAAPARVDTPLVQADGEKLRQVLLNLLTNAIKFTEPGGRVVVAGESDRAAGVVRLRVCDTGRGIPADQLERIFEPFVQVDRHRTQASQQGVGLGLAISRDLARAMGGDLTVTSEEGQGSTFTLTLRLASGDEAPVGTTPARHPGQGGA